MIKREDMKEIVEAVAATFSPDLKGEKNRTLVARLLVEMAESWIECNRARAQYYMRPTPRYRMEE